MMYLIGNPTHDTLSINKNTVQALGGTVWYAALFLTGLGRRVAVVGTGDAEIKRRLARRGVDVRHFSDAGSVTVFENTYSAGIRKQRAWAGGDIHPADVPQAAFDAPGLLIGPVLQEVDPAIMRTPRSGCLMLDAQGFLRQISTAGDVILRMTPEAETALRHCDVLKVDAREAAVITSTGDIETAGRLLYRMGPKLVIITRGRDGACIYDGASFTQVTAPEVDVVDPTGAGDVFSAAFLVRHIATGNLVAAGRFAVTAAALSTRGFGASALPSEAEISSLMKRHF
ncbi:MAG: PfkB family carbohydrate kinase [Desulfobacterales bacterium]|jgi:sugar/nucleoside kinase (ribokinase family)